MADKNAYQFIAESVRSTFVAALYREHLEEASFLYEQRLVLLDDPELTWVDLDDFEDRAEAHLDGLIVGGNGALEICREQAREGDFGEMHAAVCVFCRRNRLDLVLETLERLDSEDHDRVRAVGDALVRDMPSEWAPAVVGKLSDANPGAATIAARIVGYRRLAADAELLRALPACDSDVLPPMIWALGRLRSREARKILDGYLRHKDPAVRAAAALALLRIGEASALQYCMAYAREQEWPLLPLGLGGNRACVATLLNSERDTPHPDALLALGLLGDPSSVDALLFHMENADLAESTAEALNLITGASLYEEVFVPEEIDEDELFDDELEALRRGESVDLKPPGGEPPGIEVTRLSRDHEVWRDWWSDNKSRFRTGIRYRNGKPCAPARLLENVTSEKSSRRIRRLAYEEMVIRYGIDVPFEVDMPVAQQRRVLAKLADLVEAEEDAFQEGRWYLGGRLYS